MNGLSIYQFVDAMVEKGYTPIPGYITRDGTTIPEKFGDGEIYPSNCKIEKWGKMINPWDNAQMIGLRLDNLILVDYDGNETEELRPTISPQQLAKQLGVQSLHDSLVQWGIDDKGNYNGSFHFLFLLPKNLNRKYFKNSQDGVHFRGIDIKTGNQMLWIKRHKVQNFPDKLLLPKATESMIELLRDKEADTKHQPAIIRSYNHSQKRGIAWLDEVCSRLATMGAGSGRNGEFNQMALAAVRHALANELPLAMAENNLKAAAMNSGLTKTEITATWKSAYRKALKDGPKNLQETR